MNQPSILFFGLQGTFSYWPFRALLEQGFNLCGVVVPAGTPIPTPHHQPNPLTLRPHTLLDLAQASHIPIFQPNDLAAPTTLATLAQLQPDIACVACFNQRIPPALLSLPQHGFLNVHPSLLPAYRGPTPLFWLLRDGAVTDMGVTIHKMDAGWDTGDIICQTPLTLPDGIPGRTANKLHSQLGGQLLSQALNQLKTGTFKATPKGTPQPAGGTYHTWPHPADFILDPTSSAQRAYNFMRGTAEWGHPYTLTLANHTLQLRTAHTFTTNTLPQPIVRKQGQIGIQFRPGTLWAS